MLLKLKKNIGWILVSIIMGLTYNSTSYANENAGLAVPSESKTKSMDVQYDKVVPLQQRTKEEIIQKSKELPHNGLNEYPISNWYTNRPNIQNPYKLGGLTDEYLLDGLNSINMVRYIAGLPDDIELRDDLNVSAQYGAVLTGANGYLNHHPNKPSDMNQDFYDLGFEATSSSNLGKGYRNLSDFNIDCIDDSHTSNIDSVGHRRWLLNPQLKYVGMGAAKSESDYGYYATKVFDRSREEYISYDFLGWPASGDFPTQYFDYDQAWSISLNPNKYPKYQSEDVKVEMTRLNDNKKWTLDSSISLSNGQSRDLDFFNINVQNIGSGLCIIFRPGHVVDYKDGDVFEVNVTGLIDHGGNNVDLSYKVDFFDMNESPSIPGESDSHMILSGENKYDTAKKISFEGWTKDNSDAVVIVNGDSIADGITATPLANAYNAPILLTDKYVLPEETVEVIKHLQPENIILIGGQNSISEQVRYQLSSQVVSMTNFIRLEGKTRYETSLEVAKYLSYKSDFDSAYIVYGYGEADALSIAAKAAEENQPIILTNKNSVDPNTYNWLASQNLQDAYFIGGPNSINDNVIHSINNITANDVSGNRVAGIDRVETNSKVIEKFYQNNYYENVFVAKSDVLVDALCVGPLAAKRNSPVVLTSGNSLRQSQVDAFKDKKVKSVYSIGGINEKFGEELIELMDN